MAIEYRILTENELHNKNRKKLRKGIGARLIKPIMEKYNSVYRAVAINPAGLVYLDHFWGCIRQGCKANLIMLYCCVIGSVIR